MSEIRQRAGYGNQATGAYLETRFGRPPYGAPPEVVQALAAAAIRAGLVEVIHQGARIARADDARLERALGTLPPFRAASFAPQAGEIDVITRTKVAQQLAELTGEHPSPAVEALAPLLRSTFGSDGEACNRVRAALSALGLGIPQPVTRTADIVDQLLTGSEKDAVRTAAQTWADLVAGRKTVQALAHIIDEQIGTLRAAVAQVQAGAAGLGEDAEADLAKLRDLLAAGDLADHLAEIKACSARLARTRHATSQALLEKLEARVTEERQRIRTAFAALDAVKVAEALRPLDALLAQDDGESVPVDVLEARFDAVPARAEQARHVLEVLVAGQFVRVEVGRFAPDPIATEEELDVVLGRIRDAIQAELGEGKKVKLA